MSQFIYLIWKEARTSVRIFSFKSSYFLENKNLTNLRALFKSMRRQVFFPVRSAAFIRFAFFSIFEEKVLNLGEIKIIGARRLNIHLYCSHWKIQVERNPLKPVNHRGFSRRAANPPPAEIKTKHENSNKTSITPLKKYFEKSGAVLGLQLHRPGLKILFKGFKKACGFSNKISINQCILKLSSRFTAAVLFGFVSFSAFGEKEKEEKVLNLGEIEITGEVRRPNIQLIFPKKYFEEAVAILAKKELKSLEQELLKPEIYKKKKK